MYKLAIKPMLKTSFWILTTNFKKTAIFIKENVYGKVEPSIPSYSGAIMNTLWCNKLRISYERLIDFYKIKKSFLYFMRKGD